MVNLRHGKRLFSIGQTMALVLARWDWPLVLMAGIIGSLAGLLAMLFDGLVRYSEQFFAMLSDAEGSKYRLLLLAPVPALGGLAVGLFQVYIAKSGPGHGIPEVIESIALRRGVMRRRVGLFKMITASLTIGSGGSAGQEGPIVQIGAVLGSGIGQFVRVSRVQMYTLVSCGAAAGLAALFNAPIAGVMFVLEVILRDFSMRRFMPIVVAAVMGTATARAFHDNNTVFTVPEVLRSHPIIFIEIFPTLFLGVLCGLMGVVYIKSLHKMEHVFAHSKVPAALRSALGGLCVGLLGVLFVLVFGQGTGGYRLPPFMGNGYPVLQWLFDPRTYGTDPLQAQLKVGFAFLALALLGKLLATSLTLGSGGSGGTFAPSLFMGATMGSAFGVLVRHLPGFADSSPANFALIGMAGVLAGAVHCPLTAFLLMFELTNDYRIILPAMLVSVISASIARSLMKDSLYTLPLRERGLDPDRIRSPMQLMPGDIGALRLLQAVSLLPSDPASRLVELVRQFPGAHFVLCDAEGRYTGMLDPEDLRHALAQHDALSAMAMADFATASTPVLHADDSVTAAMDCFLRTDVELLPVLDDKGCVSGLLERHALMQRYHTLMYAGE